MSSFEDFWNLYPRKVAKRAALKEWEKEMRGGTDPSEIIAGLTRQLPMLARKEQQFIPHARTWLHQGRWEDEPEVAPKPRNYADTLRSMFDGSADMGGGRDDVQRLVSRH